MAQTKFKGSPIHTAGELPSVGATAPDFTLVKTDLSERKLSSYSGKKILNIFPSVDTPVCARSVRTFHERAEKLPGVTVLNISADLPFAHTRFCASEGISNAEGLSTFRGDFGQKYGVTLVDGPLAGLLARSVLVLDEQNKVLHVELVPEIAQEPNYDAALAKVQ
ncbi:thiol peroxidase [Sorangium atrum]|uniref:Thiol peroxidase n=1 Tax=Sorangium atrum TaxID=2995308 RepID=A0ABT5BWU8_9BACT|nr:thiol peroxidase [Sorangium aterium]MDC0677888.1 thiol peroxidase [Sorangium aterium]